MAIQELRDPEEARHYIYQSLWLQRAMQPTALSVRPALSWALEVASEGIPLPPVGFIADLGAVAFGMDWEARTNRQPLILPGLPPHLLPTYEDHVLGKIYADWSFTHAAEAMRCYAEGRDRARALAFVIRQFQERTQGPGVEMAPGIIAAALDLAPDEVLRLGYEIIEREGVHPLLIAHYEGLIQVARRMAEMLGSEDIFELQHGTALDEEGERLALRQVLRAAQQLEATLPRHRVRPLPRREEVPTRVLDEDTYPVGGFSSISTRGSLESLLHSQLAYMEGERPDLFDIKYLRDELLFYSRDENQFLRRRRSFLIAFFPGLIEKLRFKDAELPYQRGILLLATLLVIERKLTEWLSTDALQFEFICFVPDNEAAVNPMQAERELLERLWREEIANGTVCFTTLPTPAALPLHCAQRARRSMCHCLTVFAQPQPLDAPQTVVTRMQLAGPSPALGSNGEALVIPEGEDALERWASALRQILQRWI